MTRRRYRLVAARRLHDGTAALWRTWNVRQKTATLGGSAIIVLKIAPHQPSVMALGAAGWAVAAWRASAPTANAPEPPTSDDSSQKGTDGGGGEGMTIITTPHGTATSSPHPTQPNRTIITWKDTP